MASLDSVRLPNRIKLDRSLNYLPWIFVPIPKAKFALCQIAAFMSPDHLLKKNPKRKIKDQSSTTRKKAKTRHHTLDELPWKTVSRPQEAGLDGDDGILELEEIEGVEVVYENTEGGRIAKFNVRYITRFGLYVLMFLRWYKKKGENSKSFQKHGKIIMLGPLYKFLWLKRQLKLSIVGASYCTTDCLSDS